MEQLWAGDKTKFCFPGKKTKRGEKGKEEGRRKKEEKPRISLMGTDSEMTLAKSAERRKERSTQGEQGIATKKHKNTKFLISNS